MTSDQQERLAAESMPYAKRVAARYARQYPRFRDDLESAAMLGVLKATRTRDDEQSVWDFWLKRCVRWGIGQRLKELRRKGFYNQELQARSGEAAYEFEVENQELREIDFSDLVDVGLDCLTKQQRSVITSVYLKDLTVTEAGNILGLSHNRASEIHHEALAKLKEFIREQRAA